MARAKPCRTCGHPKRTHEGDVNDPTCCRIWPMPGTWAECPCTEYVPPDGSESHPVDYESTNHGHPIQHQGLRDRERVGWLT